MKLGLNWFSIGVHWSLFFPSSADWMATAAAVPLIRERRWCDFQRCVELIFLFRFKQKGKKKMKMKRQSIKEKMAGHWKKDADQGRRRRRRLPDGRTRRLHNWNFFFFIMWQGFTGFYWVLPGFTGFLLGFIEFYWVLLGFTGFNWVSSSLTGFDWVLSSFTGFYRVLLGFYWVLQGFTWS